MLLLAFLNPIRHGLLKWHRQNSIQNEQIIMDEQKSKRPKDGELFKWSKWTPTKFYKILKILKILNIKHPLRFVVEPVELAKDVFFKGTEDPAPNLGQEYKK